MTFSNNFSHLKQTLTNNLAKNPYLKYNFKNDAYTK